MNRFHRRNLALSREKQEQIVFDARAFFAGRDDWEGSKGYLILHGGDVTSKVVMANPELRKKHLVVRDIDGIPHTCVKTGRGWLKSLIRSKIITQLYSLMTQMLAEADVKEFFYDVWLKHNNYEAGCERRRGIAQNDRLRREGKRIGPTEDGAYIHGITQTRSVRANAALSV